MDIGVCDRVKLFVYGTLKHGHCRTDVLAKATFLHEIDLPGYLMFDTGHGYPAVVEGNGSVRGEVYETDLTTLCRLDEIEGVPSLYKRVLQDDLWLYVWVGDLPPDVRMHEIGEWTLDHEERSRVS